MLAYATQVQPVYLIRFDYEAQERERERENQEGKERERERERESEREKSKHAKACWRECAGHYLGHVCAMGRNLPRKTVSLVVALASPTLLEATHS